MGARADLRQLNRMLGRLVPGDVVTVTRIYRLAAVRRTPPALAECRQFARRPGRRAE
jgi:hypothetical protein